MAALQRYKKLSLKEKERDEDATMEIIEDTEKRSAVRKSPSTTVNDARTSPSRSSTHKRTYPLRGKGYLYARWSFGAAIIVILLALIVAAIALISVAPGCETPWWKTTVIYQCYPQSFQDSNGDGLGDFQGILQRASHFSDIGVKAVWLNPIFESPQKDAGYDISNYTAIDDQYGTMEQLKQLLEELHKRGIHLLLDFVPNHTSDQHPWFKDSRSSKSSPKRDWYMWADGAQDGGPPNNWISAFGGSAWEYDNVTDQYYLHQFSLFQPDLNYSNPEVREAITQVLRFWLLFGVDGFRVDAVSFLLEDRKLRDESPNLDFSPPPGVNCTANPSNRSCYSSLVHNLTTNLPGIHEIFREWREVVNSFGGHGREKVLIGEVYAPLETTVTYYGKNNDEFTFPFNFLLLTNNNWTGTVVSCIVSQFLDHLPTGAWPNWVLGNHDNSRIASRAGIYLARALYVLLLTLPGTPTTYYGEEIFMTDVDIPDSRRRDMLEDRDKERTPMQWNTSAWAGFTLPSSTPWLPVSPNFTKYNVMVENNTSSMLHLYKKLVQLRSTQRAFQVLNYSCVNATDEILAYLRYAPESTQQYLIVINFSEEMQEIELDVPLSEAVIELSSFLNRTDSVNFPGNVTLAGGEALVIKGVRPQESCDTGSVRRCDVCNGTLV